jgi:hypothetical protein
VSNNGFGQRPDPTTAPPPGDERRSTPVRPLAQLAARVGLWSLVGLGCLGFFLALLGAGAAAPPPAPVANAEGPPAGVAGFAEEATIAWLEATGDPADRASALFVDAPEPPSGPTTASVRRTTVVGARQIDGDYWAVTVAAVVDERDRDRATVGTSTLYAEVGVVVGPAGEMAAVGTPAVVPGPPPLTIAVRAAGPTPGIPGVDDPVMVAAQGFLSALLTGTGDVSRYLAPGVEVTAVNPPPFTEVTVDRLSVSEIDGATRARVLAVATTAAGGRRTVGYELGIRERAGRWEITSISGAPALDDQRPESNPASTAAPTPPPSTPASPSESSTTTSFATEPGA